jgi:RNA polymerase subunit RPABC4/transcription elongation factor Spt4
VMVIPKVSSCVDCATPIIGDRQRCPACRYRHATPKPSSTGQALVAWLGTVLIIALIAIIAVLLMAAGRSC